MTPTSALLTSFPALFFSNVFLPSALSCIFFFYLVGWLLSTTPLKYELPPGKGLVLFPAVFPGLRTNSVWPRVANQWKCVEWINELLRRTSLILCLVHSRCPINVVLISHRLLWGSNSIMNEEKGEFLEHTTLVRHCYLCCCIYPSLVFSHMGFD